MKKPIPIVIASVIVAAGTAVAAAGSPFAPSTPASSAIALPGVRPPVLLIAGGQEDDTPLTPPTSPAPLAVGIARAGAYSVTAPRRVWLHDAKRGKDLLLSVTAPVLTTPTATGRNPVAVASFPVIVFSHGAGASGRDGFAITSYWASHGYIVLCPTHADSVALAGDARDARERGRRDGRDSGGGGDGSDGSDGRGGGGLRQLIAGSMRDPTSGAERARDVSFVLDSLDEIARRVPDLSGRMDKKRIGVGGHSLGAYTAQLLGGATVSLPSVSAPAAPAAPASFRDERVRAVLQLSGQGAGQQGLTRESWKDLTLPMMTVTGTGDRGARGQGPAWKKEPFDNSPATGNKYHLVLTGAHHGSFTGRFAGVEPTISDATTAGRTRQAGRPARLGGGFGFGPGGDQRAIFGRVEAATLAFWDAHLKGDARARVYLNGQTTGPTGPSDPAVDTFIKAAGDAARLFHK